MPVFTTKFVDALGRLRQVAECAKRLDLDCADRLAANLTSTQSWATAKRTPKELDNVAARVEGMLKEHTDKYPALLDADLPF
jgi:hypothetical protein